MSKGLSQAVKGSTTTIVLNVVYMMICALKTLLFLYIYQLAH